MCLLAGSYVDAWRYYKEVLTSLLDRSSLEKSILHQRIILATGYNLLKCDHKSCKPWKYWPKKLFHSVGASRAALCYTPQKKVPGWSWQTYWLAQASVCWLLLPVIAAWLTIPQLGTVLREATADVLWKTFALGMAYGVGGTAFGMAIRYVGFSLTYAISVGISCVLGTLIPPLCGELECRF